MIFRRFAVLPAIVAALLIIGAFKASAGEVDRVDARFEVFGIAGLHVLTTRTTVEEAADRYAIAADLDTRGLASVFVDLTSHSEVHGRLARDAPYPFDYRADMRRNGTDRHYGRRLPWRRRRDQCLGATVTRAPSTCCGGTADPRHRRPAYCVFHRGAPARPARHLHPDSSGL